jgi:2'-5' RNA ligase
MNKNSRLSNFEALDMQHLPLIVTAKMDADSFDFLNALRREHFPPERNHLSAHITLFHHLPGERLVEIEDFLKITASRQAVSELHFRAVKFIGRGTIVEIESAPLISLRNKLAARWSDWLTPQDRQKFVPHVTVQNKAAPEAARNLYERLKETWQPRTGLATALQLWHYQNGPWQIAGEFDFCKIAEL